MHQCKLIFLFALALVAFSDVYAEDNISKICRGTLNPRICESSLRGDPRSSKTDTTGLIEIMIDVVNTRFTDSVGYVNKLIKESPPSAKATALKKCLGNFQIVITYDIPEAKQAVPDPKFAINAMLDAVNEVTECSTAITSFGSELSSLIERTKLLSDLSNITIYMLGLML